MSTPVAQSPKLVPAQVGFLAIYNPSLGDTDKTLDDQVVYFSSSESRQKNRRPHKNGSPFKSSQEERNERLRKIGLAQGIVEFGRNFSEGKSVDTIDTEKSRIIIHELEPSWWLIASIDLTRLPVSKSKPGGEDGIEYSSREVKPPALLLENLLRAHSTFLLHHASSMNALLARTSRLKFIQLVGRYWDSFLSTWDVMLHGNPLTSVFRGIKIASSGELGVGVGEEDRGSGEREVLEGFVGRIDGLVDLVVSKFGGASLHAEEEKRLKEGQLQIDATPRQPWLGTGAEPESDDGVVFLGVGALSRKSLCNLTHWMEDIYSWGSRAYGVRDNPIASRKTRKKREKRKSGSAKDGSLARGLEGSLLQASLQLRPGVDYRSAEEHTVSTTKSQSTAVPPHKAIDPHLKKPSKEKQLSVEGGRSSQPSIRSTPDTGGKIVDYLKLGYGTHWSLGGNINKPSGGNGSNLTKQDDSSTNQLTQDRSQGPIHAKDAEPTCDNGSDSSAVIYDDSVGHYLIGFIGDIEKDEVEIGEHDNLLIDGGGNMDSNYRVLLRTVTVELEREGDTRSQAEIDIETEALDIERSHSSKIGGSEHSDTHTPSESQNHNMMKNLRIVVYLNKPFIFTFLFELQTDTLALMSFYKSLHYQLGPLRQPLLASTSQPLSRPDMSATNTQDVTPIYDLIWDSKSLTISSTIPNIPEPSGSPLSTAPWSRIEALNTHMQLLNTFTATRFDRSELECTSKTSRGWWVVWTRIPDPDDALAFSYTPLPVPGVRTPELRSEDNANTIELSSASISNNTSLYSGPAHPFLNCAKVTKERPISFDREIFLLRRASDYSDGRSLGNFISLNSSTGEGGWDSGTAKLAQGIGVDTKRYIEDLLNMHH